MRLEIKNREPHPILKSSQKKTFSQLNRVLPFTLTPETAGCRHQMGGTIWLPYKLGEAYRRLIGMNGVEEVSSLSEALGLTNLDLVWLLWCAPVDIGFEVHRLVGGEALETRALHHPVAGI